MALASARALAHLIVCCEILVLSFLPQERFSFAEERFENEELFDLLEKTPTRTS
jgi:hypothetical protein